MIETVSNFALTAISLFSLLVLLRLIKGPTMADRAMALDVLTVNVIAILVLFGIRGRSIMFFDAALVFAILSFLGTVALGLFFERGDIFGSDR